MEKNEKLALTESISIPLLKDFKAFMDYIGSNNVTLMKKSGFIERKALYAMNAQMTFPVPVMSDRYDQPSYRLLHLLHHLALAAKLIRKEPIKGDKYVLRLTERYSLFLEFSLTEQYVSLLETLWVDADWAKLENVQRRIGWVTPYMVDLVFEYLSQFPANERIEFSEDSVGEALNRMGDFIPILEFFGFWQTEEQEKYSSKRRYFAVSITPLPLLKRLAPTLAETRDVQHWNLPLRRGVGEWKAVPGSPLPGESAQVPSVSEEPFIRTFTPLFPAGELQQSLPRERNTFTDGTITFKIAVRPDCWRRVALSAKHTLYDLHRLIQQAFRFSDDHLYAFFMDGEKWSRYAFYSPDDHETPSVKEASLGELGLTENQRFLYLSDYGDEWQFHVEVESIDTNDVRVLKPQIIETQGMAPKQYSR